MSLCKITLEGIRLFGRHGCEAFEAEKGGNFEMEISVEYEEPREADRDTPAERPDYAGLHRHAVHIFTTEKFSYLEPLAARIAEELLRFEPVLTTVRVAIRKLRPPVGGPIESVRVESERHR